MRFKNSSLETRCRRPLYSRGPEEVTTTASSVVVVLSTLGGGWLCLGRSSSIGSSSHVSEATLYVVTLTGWSERSALNPYRPSDGKTSRTREVASRACRLSSQGTRALPQASHQPLQASEHHHQPKTGPGQDDAVSPGPAAVQPSFHKSNTSHDAASPGPTHDGVHWSAVRPNMGNDRLSRIGMLARP